MTLRHRITTSEQHCVITAINYLLGNEYFWSDKECSDRTKLDTRISNLKIRKQYARQQYMKITTNWPLFHAYSDNHLKLFNLKPTKAYSAANLKTFCASPGDFRKLFDQQKTRSYILVAQYFPESLVMQPFTHAMAVKYSRKKKSYVITGLNNNDLAAPQLVNECCGSLMREF